MKLKGNEIHIYQFTVLKILILYKSESNFNIPSRLLLHKIRIFVKKTCRVYINF